MIVHGFTEYAEKYVEMIYYFLQAGYQVYSMDLRGHGRSVREQKDLSLVHIGRYQQYLTDLEYMAKNIVSCEDRALSMYLYGHSMGGGIAAAFMQWKPDIFQRAVLSSPMIRPLTGGIPIGIVRGIVGISVKLGKGGRYVPGHHAFRGMRPLKAVRRHQRNDMHIMPGRGRRRNCSRPTALPIHGSERRPECQTTY